MDALCEVVRTLVPVVAEGGEREARWAADVLRPLLKERGLKANCHVGRSDLRGGEVVEWYAGQLLGIVDGEKWFAMNAWINCADKFVGGE